MDPAFLEGRVSLILKFENRLEFDQVLLKKCIGRLYGNFLDLLIFKVGK